MGFGSSILKCALRKKEILIVKLLVEAGADIFYQAHGRSMIECAKLDANSEIVEFLEQTNLNLIKQLEEKKSYVARYIPPVLAEIVAEYLGLENVPQIAHSHEQEKVKAERSSCVIS